MIEVDKIPMTYKAERLRVKIYENEHDETRSYADVRFDISGEQVVKIYRKEMPGFQFDYDEEEYFDDYSPTEDDIIYQGTLEVKHGYSEYKDYDVQTGMVYAYWVKTEASDWKVTGPVGVKIRDPRVWWHFDKIMSEMKILEDKYKNVSLVQVGETVAHKPLTALIVGNKDNLIAGLGVIHAGESGPEILIESVKELLDKKPEIFDKTGIVILPSVNADMREEMACGLPRYCRVNKNGVDLNRNFDVKWEEVSYGYGLATDDPECVTYRGTSPNSEPETKAVINFIRTVKPKIILSYHALASITCDDLLCASSMEKGEFMDELEKIARLYSCTFRRSMDEPPRDGDILLPICSAGGLGEWAYHNGFFSLDIELRNDGKLEPFLAARKDRTTFELLRKNIVCHTACIYELLTYFGEQEGAEQ